MAPQIIKNTHVSHVLSRHQDAGQTDHNIANRSIENVAQFKYLGTTVNKSKFNSRGN
jgi:hypothetical protein